MILISTQSFAKESGKIHEPSVLVACDTKEDARSGAVLIFAKLFLPALQGKEFTESSYNSAINESREFIKEMTSSCYELLEISDPSKVFVYKKTKDYRPNAFSDDKDSKLLFHYAQITLRTVNNKSIESASSKSEAKLVKNKKLWIARIVMDGLPPMLQLDSGKSW